MSGLARTSGQEALTLAPKPKASQTILVEVNSRDRNYSAANQITNSFRFTFQRPIKERDLFLLFTDGLFECMNSRGEEFGRDRLMRVVEEHRVQHRVHRVDQYIDQ